MIINKIKNLVRRKGLRLSIYSVLVPLIMQFLYIRYISYNVDEAIFGNFILYVSFIALIAALIFSIPFAAITRYINETSNKERFINEFLTLLLPLNILGAVIIFIYYLYMDLNFLIFLAMLAYFVLMNRYSINKIIIFQLIKRKQYFYISIAEKLARFLFPLIIFYFFPNDYGLLCGLLLGYVLLVVYTVRESNTFKRKYTFSYRKVRIYFLYAYPVIFTAAASWIISLSDRFFISHYIDSKSVGIYSILAQVAGLGSILGSIFVVYAQPLIYKKYSENKEEAIKLYFKYVKIILVIFILLYIVFLFLPKIVFTILVNPEIINNDNYFLIFNILFISSLLGVFVTISSHFFHLLNKIYVLTIFWCVAAFVNLCGNFLIKDYGIIAASLSTMSANFIVVFLMYFWIFKMISGKTNAKK